MPWLLGSVCSRVDLVRRGLDRSLVKKRSLDYLAVSQKYPKWVALANGTMTKICGPIPGGFILTHSHLSFVNQVFHDMSYDKSCPANGALGAIEDKRGVLIALVDTGRKDRDSEKITPAILAVSVSSKSIVRSLWNED